MTDFADPQAAEDAYYDAFDDFDIEGMMKVWADSDETVCLLPMFPALKGRAAIRKAFEPLLDSKGEFEIQVKHLHWIEQDNLAIHLVEEAIKSPNVPNQSVYANNIYQKGPNGWRMIMHQNSPVPVPPPKQ